MHGPLEGVRVIELGNYMAAPFCAMQLADLGAEVIKVENPSGGDEVRQAAPFLGDESSAFLRLNRNKRSLALDLKPAAGRAVFQRLAESADVVVENLRPGTMARLQLDYPRLSQLNEGLIYVAASGWGQDGPLASLAGLDIMAQARSGLMSITGEPGGDPVKLGVPVCDLVCGLYGALAAVSALRARDQTGQGQFIDVSLFEAGVSLTIWEAGRYFATGEVPGPNGSAHQNNAPYQAVRTADGWLTVGATTPRNWGAFCRTLGLERLLADDRYTTNAGRFQDRSALIAEIEAVTTTATVSHWLGALEKAGVPCAPIQDIAQVYGDPHLNARGYFWEGIHPKLGSVRQLGSPMRLSATPACRDSSAPLLGEHTLAVLELLGYTAEELRRLREQGVIVSPEP